jgi:hypothetical protein
MAMLNLVACQQDSPESDITTDASKKKAVPVPVEATPVASPPIISPTTDSSAGAASVPDNFDTALALDAVALAPQSADPEGSFRFVCSPAHTGNFDPIVYPNGVSPHGHQFFGNNSVTANSTYTSLRTTGETTCGNASTPVNRSAYWLPAMLDGVGGLVTPKYINIYYKRLPKDHPGCAVPGSGSIVGKMGYCVGLPNGLRFIQGYNMGNMTGGPNDLSSIDSEAMKFECREPNEGRIISTKHNLEDLTCAVGNELMITMGTVTCWDGVNLDSADHRSHVSNGTRDELFGPYRGCPSTHPYHIPNLTVFIHYTVDSTFRTWQLTSDRQMSAAMGTKLVRGSTLHMDYHEAWSPVVRKMWEENCLDRRLSCSGGDLGNGKKIKGAAGPAGGFPMQAKIPAAGLN